MVFSKEFSTKRKFISNICSTNPTTRFYKGGCCKTGFNDTIIYMVCGIMEEKFLNFLR